ncbi:HAD family hydrolase [Microtetraspora sp. NBRC 16547]|uniref:HAD family hydrolase n=1 Tax=Microtetraspora sp. NBRC 16547 TaxID=3030993 RepID=UPI0024A32D5C|nr:HAD family hydrolase [Microtetraspora sp. NBRC 16547]GLX00034.1 hydrolase [Microtetraspora sp. NBRC 16547]
MISAILFDLDETLFDHRGAVAYAATAWTESFSPGHELLTEVPALWLGLEERHLPAWYAGECSFAEQRRRRLRDFCRRLGLPLPADLDAAYAEFLLHYEAAWTAFPDAAEAMDALSGRGLTLGVLTNGVPVLQEAKLRRIGLMDRLDPVLTPDALGGTFKPAAECYLAAAAKLGLRPEEILLVGDNLDLDAIGPTTVGMHGVWLDRYGTPQQAGTRHDHGDPRSGTSRRVNRRDDGDPGSTTGDLPGLPDLAKPSRPCMPPRITSLLELPALLN